MCRLSKDNTIQLISSYSWEVRLPFHGPSFDRVVAHLTTIGIANKIEQLGVNQIGKTVIDALMLPFVFLPRIIENPIQQVEPIYANMIHCGAAMPINEQLIHSVQGYPTSEHSTIQQDGAQDYTIPLHTPDDQITLPTSDPPIVQDSWELFSLSPSNIFPSWCTNH